MIPTPTRTAKSVARKANTTDKTGNTPLSNRHLTPPRSPLNRTPQATSTASIDYFETGGIISWGNHSPNFELRDLEADALQARRTRRIVNHQIGQYIVQVHRSGLGDGQDSYTRYHFTWNGVTIGIDPRHSDDRMLYNYRLTARGEACTVLGLATILRFQREVIRALGGKITDSWVKRFDICWDVANKLIIDELLRSMHEECYIASSRNRPDIYETGFAVMTQDILLRIYDKLAEMRVHHHSADYRRVMVQRLGMNPTSATRIEIQFRKEWLHDRHMRTTSLVLSRLKDIIERVTGVSDRSFLRITEKKPDRKNGNTARAKTLPLWTWIIAAMREGIAAMMPEIIAAMMSEIPSPTKKRKPRP